MSFEGIEPGPAFKDKIGEVMGMCADEVFRIFKEKGVKPDRLTVITNMNAMTMQFVSHLMLMTLLAQSEASKEADKMMEKFAKFSKTVNDQITPEHKKEFESK